MKKNASAVLEYILYLLIKTAVLLLPRPVCLRAGGILGLLFFRFDGKHRRIALDNLKTAFENEKPPEERLKIAETFFIHFGRLIFDILKFPRLKDRQKTGLMRVSGKEYLKEALARGNGALLFSGHFGNWEIAPSFLTRMGNLKVIARPLDNPLLEKDLFSLRRLMGAGIISKFDAARPILRSLKTGDMVAILIDQNVLRSQAVFVDFFGKPAATTPAPAALYLRSHSPLIPVFCYPDSPRGYRLEIGNPLRFEETGDYHRDVLKITQLCTKMIEQKIREHPEYWLWIHRRWKTRPAGRKPAKEK